jgi:nucleotide-binding universal stress UspA family protein
MKILLAADGLDAQSGSIRFVTKLFHECPDNRLIVMHVSNANVPFYRKTPVGMEETLSEAEITNTERIVKTVTSSLYPWKDQIKFLHATGHPAAMICKIAEDEGVDIIVIGNHGHGVADRFGIGGVCQGVLAKTTIPVLVAK